MRKIAHRSLMTAICLMLLSADTILAENSDYYLEASLLNSGGSVVLNGFPSLGKPEREDNRTVSHWCTPMLVNGENTVTIRFQPAQDNEWSKFGFHIVSHPNGVPRTSPENDSEIISRNLSSHTFYKAPVLTANPEQNRYHTVASGNLVISRSDPVPAVSMEFLMESGENQHALENVSVHLFHSSAAPHVVYKAYVMNPGTGVQTISLVPQHIVHGRKWLLPNPPFKFSEQSWDRIRQEGVPEDIIKVLKLWRDKPYEDETAFAEALKEEIGETRTDQYKSLILKHALSEIEFDRILIQCDSAAPVTTTVSSLKMNGAAFAPTAFSPLERVRTEWTGTEPFRSLPRMIFSSRTQLMNITVRLKKSNDPQNAEILFGEFGLSSFDKEIVLSSDNVISGSEWLGNTGFDSVRIEGDIHMHEDERHISQITFIDKGDWEETITLSRSGLSEWKWASAEVITAISEADKDAIWNIVVAVRNALYEKDKAQYTQLMGLKIDDLATAMYKTEAEATDFLTKFVASIVPQSEYLASLDKTLFDCLVYENRKVVKAQTTAGEDLIVSSHPVSDDMTEEDKEVAWNNTYTVPLYFSRVAGTWKIVSAFY